jgi:MFS family permease
MKSFGTAVALLGAFFAAAAVPSPLLVLLQQQRGFGTPLLTLAFAVYALSLLVTMLLAGSLSDRVGRRPVPAVACSLQIAVCAVFVLAPQVWWIVGARAAGRRDRVGEQLSERGRRRDGARRA